MLISKTETLICVFTITVKNQQGISLASVLGIIMLVFTVCILSQRTHSPLCRNAHCPECTQLSTCSSEKYFVGVRSMVGFPLLSSSQCLGSCIAFIFDFCNGVYGHFSPSKGDGWTFLPALSVCDSRWPHLLTTLC